MDIWVYGARRAGMFFASVFSLLCLFSAPLQALPVFINELHYDNTGADVGEAVEIAGPAGTDLNDWWLLLYNGSNGGLYKSIALNGSIPDFGGGTGFVEVQPGGGMQNGPGDGLALVDSAARVLQFISYEGTVSATGGVAAGLTSIDIGVLEDGSTAVGESLQLAGVGSEYEHFHWVVGSESFAAVNIDQRFVGRPDAVKVPTPDSLLLIAVGLIALLLVRYRWRLGGARYSGVGPA